MVGLNEVLIQPLPPERFEEVLLPQRFAEFRRSITRAQDLLAGRVVWNINSTARGGGVAEMLQSLLAYTRGADIDARWVVIEGTPEFFAITKRIHNNLHGAPGDGGELGPTERSVYVATLETNADVLSAAIGPGDVVIVHDPQPAGLIEAIKGTGAAVVWRCHVGLDMPNDIARRAWDFLMPYVQRADAFVFSRRAFAWDGLDHEAVRIIPPSIDAFAPKNQGMEPSSVEAILETTGLLSGSIAGSPTYERWDGSRALVASQSVYRDGGPPPPAAARLAVQVSRWDRLKDPVGVIEGFSKFVPTDLDAHLIVAGPEVEAVSDDPEGAEVLDECAAAVEALPADLRDRVHLACLPMDDLEENAAIVNALQRRADVVIQKSLAEGFGLTVSEAMWKARPVVASRIGGIQDQVIHGVTGRLIDDPRDLRAYGTAVADLLDDEYAAAEMGVEAQMRVRDEFLGPRHLMQYVSLFESLLVSSSRR